MKKFICFLLAIVLVMPVFAQTVVYAKSYDVCPVNGIKHDFFSSYTLNVEHPHEGFYECKCGEKIVADSILYRDCDICRDILCNAGLHCFLDNIYYTDKAYGKCFCGTEIVIDCSKSQFDKHLYNVNRGYVVDNCPVCAINNEYYNNYEDFALSYSLSYIPPVSEDHTNIPSEHFHDISHKTCYSVKHPHQGYFQCNCGKFSYFDSYVATECEDCTKTLCNNNIHYYVRNLSYSNNMVSISCNYCDSKVYTPCTHTEYLTHTNHTTTYSDCPLCQIASHFWSQYDELNQTRLYPFYWEDERVEEEVIYPPVSPDIQDSIYDVQYFSTYTCSSNNGEHDFSSMLTCSSKHPHKGYFECECGEKLHFERKIEESCNECLAELCVAGIHNYTYSIHYINFPSGYGQCSCGATKDFATVTHEYKELRIDNSTKGYQVPCPECTFKTVFKNQVLEYELNDHLQKSAAIYSNGDVELANKYYTHALDYTCIFDCYHGHNYLEVPSPVVKPTDKPTNTPTTETKPSSTPSTPQTNKPTTTPNTPQTNKPATGNQTESNTPLIPYYEYDLPEFSSMSAVKLPSRDYNDAINDIASQLFLGNYSEKVTTNGTIAEILFSLTGFDVYKDITDLVYNFTHWEFSWSHVGNTLLNAIAIIPIIGVVKNADEIAVLRKLSKLDPDTIKNLDKIGGINSSLLLKLKKLNKTEVLALMKKLDGHALTKHVGNTSEAALKSLRKGSNAISSFYTQDDAVKAVTAALKDPDVMAKIAYKMSLQNTSKFAVDFDFGKVIGVKMPENSEKIVKCSKIRVVIQQTSATDFYIKTAFPN